MQNPSAIAPPKIIALPEARELDLFARIIEGMGAVALRCPFLDILDTPHEAQVTTWLRLLVAGEFDDLILMTGEGLRRLMGFADRAGLREPVIEALSKVRTITRGPKPGRALREIGLQAMLVAEAPTTDGMLSTLAREHLRGRRVALQLYGEERGDRLLAQLEAAGAVVTTVTPYVYAPAIDSARLLDLIDRIAIGEVDAIAFTSSGQVARLWDVASQHQREKDLLAGFGLVWVAAVGPVVAETLRQKGIAVDVMPDHSFFMRPLANEIASLLQRGKKGEAAPPAVHVAP